MGVGLTLLVPNAIALAGLAMIITGSQLQVRLIEEPYLHRIHGASYHKYASRVGRFVPGIGRLHTTHQPHAVTRRTMRANA
jgi:protein-S-isoprenylcysteine O-methyltransferase Ste14